jgi:hypothetical protein
MRLVWDSATDGHWANDDDEVIPDGGRVHVPLWLVDGKRTRLDTFKVDDAALDAHRPGYRALNDAQRAAARSARDKWIADMSSAWKRPPARDAGQPDATANVALLSDGCAAAVIRADELSGQIAHLRDRLNGRVQRAGDDPVKLGIEFDRLLAEQKTLQARRPIEDKCRGLGQFHHSLRSKSVL